MEAHQFIKAPGITTAIEQAALAAANSALANAVVVRPFLSRLQTEILINLMQPRQLVFRPEVFWNHPIQRVIHNELEQYCRARAGRCLEVGAHPRSINDNPNVLHRCFLRPVGRDIQRWYTAPTRGPAANCRRSALRGLPPVDRTYCFDGFSRCSFAAETGVALYSLHDLWPADVAEAMARHGMTRLYAVLHLPPEVLLPPGTYHTTSYLLIHDGQRAVITYEGDTSAGYNHDVAILRAWVRTTKVTGDHPLVIERVRAIGCHFVLLLTAAPEPSPMPYVPYPRSTEVYVRSIFGPGGSPSLFPSACSTKSTFHAVPVHIWDRLMLFGATLDDQAFCCSRLMTYLRGISYKVTVGALVANEGWSASEDALTAVITAAYLTICHQRYLRTQAISKGMRRLELEHAQKFITRLYSWLFEKSGRDYIPGRQLEFYAQCRRWLSAGFHLDPRVLVFDEAAPCRCRSSLRKAVSRFCCFMRWLGQECNCFLQPVEGLIGDEGHDNEAYEGSEVDLAEPAAPDIDGTYTVSGAQLSALYRALGLPIDLAARASRLTATVELSSYPGRIECKTTLGNKVFLTSFLDGSRLEANGPEEFVLSFDAARQAMSAGPYSLTYEVTPAGLRVHVVSSGQDCIVTFPPGPAPAAAPGEVSAFCSALYRFNRSVQRHSLLGTLWYHPEGLLGLFPPFSPNHIWDSANPFCGESTLYTRTWSVSGFSSDFAPVGVSDPAPDMSAAGAICPPPPVSRQVSLQPTQVPEPTPLSEPGAPTPASSTMVPIAQGHTSPVRRNRRLLFTYPDGAKVYSGSLFESECTWLINASNPGHRPGGGLCHAFFQRFPESFDHTKFVMREGLAAYTLTPRPIIHAVAPDYRVEHNPKRLEAAYRETCSRLGTAAYPLLGSGIYQVPVGPSFDAWERNHRPGDELYLTDAAATWFENNKPSQPALTITEDTARTANLALEIDAATEIGRACSGCRVDPGVVHYQFTAGVPGSGKSRSIQQGDVDVVVVPTRELRDSWRRRGFAAFTPHTAARVTRGRRVVIDEAPSLPPHLLLLHMQRAASVHLLGDPNQIPAIDFENTGLVPAIRPELVPTSWWHVTHRCPADVCELIRGAYPKIQTASRVLRSLFWGEAPVGQKLVFTQAAKAANPGAITVHEAQGATFTATTIIATADARGLIQSSRAHAIVALTRHTEKCVVLDAPGLLKEIGISDSIVNNFFLSGGEIGHNKPSVIPRGTPDLNAATLDAFPPSCQISAYYQLAEELGHRPQPVAAVLPPCPELEQGLLYMPQELTASDSVLVFELTDIVHCRMAAPSQRKAVLSTLVGRYGRRTKLYEAAHSDVRESLAKFIPTIGPVQATTCELYELVEAMVEKGQDGSAVLELDLCSRDVSRITFFQKDCNKFTTGETIAHGKVGQGISAWSKTFCALFGPWFRAIEKRILALLPQNVFYADAYDDSVFSAAVSGAKASMVFENDFSEFDSTQNNFSLGLECVIMEECGMPPWLIRLYHLVRSAWILQAPKESLKGFWKKHSGEPGTLLWNTVWNMAIIAHCYEFRNLQAAAFKGDDSMVLCSDYRQSRNAATLIAGCGLKLKVDYRPIGLYAGVVVAPGLGALPDVVRFAGRLSEKNWGPDPERAEQLRLAVCDFLRKLTNVAQLCVDVVSRVYGVSPGLVHNLIGMLQTIADGKAHFTETIKPVLDLTDAIVQRRE
ncbi:nonstructural polyprotein [camel hepatitis E virus genotype 7a]|uniref:Non-structural polyprotein pORF1 n=1 Tax=camel hepatitis E virus genotype 7a TaxID=2759769 RepID=A0A023YA81_HEV|nr:nonstructural polyprotein [camel hepatitis E virus genotype 7a]